MTEKRDRHTIAGEVSVTQQTQNPVSSQHCKRFPTGVRPKGQYPDAHVLAKTNMKSKNVIVVQPLRYRDHLDTSEREPPARPFPAPEMGQGKDRTLATGKRVLNVFPSMHGNSIAHLVGRTRR